MVEIRSKIFVLITDLEWKYFDLVGFKFVYLFLSMPIMSLIFISQSFFEIFIVSHN